MIIETSLFKHTNIIYFSFVQILFHRLGVCSVGINTTVKKLPALRNVFQHQLSERHACNNLLSLRQVHRLQQIIGSSSYRNVAKERRRAKVCRNFKMKALLTRSHIQACYRQ